ncbi:SsrA-binding protein [Aerococcus urinaehominis]|uniref:SsrA-binding protein n=1 Tax=Aerococcus urinaehominis TaxID=128944 RepID=A0A109RHL7_9LACT|nr:SsrA-binding protein SmpB [Aerococcus urinaehominis]AMB98785.1 SsrA-binding protein [Aerococcus urinaehominis]SDM12731.1 SsrA-binding protein [Aerococcus urinaehominis]
MAKKKKSQDNNVKANNRKASHDYNILDTIEAGIVLKGTEIKSVRAARLNFKDGFARINQGEVWLHNVHISPFDQGNIFNHDPLRTRKLLLHKRQISRLEKEVQQAGRTLIPLKVYIKNGVAKLLLGVGEGKKKYDKRQSLKEKDMKREAQRALKY